MPDVRYTLSLQDNLTRQLQNAEAVANQLDGTMSGLQSTINNVGAAFGIAFGIGQVKDFAMSVVDAGSYVENATTGLTTLLKDAGAAAQVVQNTMEDATKTPFAFEGLLNANKALISANVSAADARGTVIDLANAIAATGGGDDELGRMVVNLQQIKNVGKATATDIKQFAFAGINIYEVLAKATGKQASEVTDMEVSYDLLTQALKRARSEGGLYANGLENMSENISVQMSNVQDAFFQLKVQMFNDLRPVIVEVLQLFSGFMATLKDLWGWSVRNADTLKILGQVALVAAGAFLVYRAALIGVALWAKINAAWQAIQYASIVLLGEGMLTASFFTKLMAGAQVLLNSAMMANPIAWVVAGIAALIAIIVVCWNKFEGFRAFMFAAWAVIKVVVGQIIEYFKAMYNVIMGALTLDLDQIQKGMEQGADVMFNSGKKIAEAAKSGWNEGIKDFAKDNPIKGGTVNSPKTLAAGGGNMPAAVTPSGSTGSGKGDTPKTATNKATTINIQIGALIKDLSFKVTNVTEAKEKIKEVAVSALLSAVNDSQITAGQ